MSDWATAENVVQKVLTKTTKQPGCLHFSWTRDGELLNWHGHFIDGDALKTHLESVRPLMETLMKEGVAKIDRIEINGPHAEINKSQSALEGFEGARFYPSDDRLRRSFEKIAFPIPRLL